MKKTLYLYFINIVGSLILWENFISTTETN